MPVPALKSIGKEHGKSLKSMERYWEQGKKEGEKKGIKNKYAYAMEIAKRRAAGTGSKPAESILKGQPAVENKTKFAIRLSEALNKIQK